MQNRKIQKILEAEDDFDLVETAKAIQIKSERESKKKIPNRKKAFAAWQKIKSQLQDDERTRQEFAKAWQKYKTPLDNSK
jgi:hypothetical protein